MMRDLGNIVVDMILFCPACGAQHVDKAEKCHGACLCAGGGPSDDDCICGAWKNPPHRSHLCHSCKHIWRPSDVHTNGVAAIRSKGVNDSPALKPVQYYPAISEWERPE